MNWNLPLSAIEGIQQSVSLNKTSASRYYAMVWNWRGFDQGGYMGLQNDGNLFTGPPTKIALFSLWNALDSRGANCQGFTNEGSGLSCRVPYAFKAGHTYVYSVSRDTSLSPGVWWTASVRDLSAKKATAIGSLRAPDNVNAESISSRLNNFSEFFGSTKPCDKVPTSDTTFRQPVVIGATSDALGTYDSSGNSVGVCTGGSVVPVGNDVQVRAGGPR